MFKEIWGTATFKLMLGAILTALASSPIALDELAWPQVIGAIFLALYGMCKRKTDKKIEAP